MASVKIEGLTALLDRVEEIKDKEALKAIIKQDTAYLQQEMQKETFSAFKKGYSVGDTRRNVFLSIEDGGMTGKVEPRTKYSPYVEYGTRFMEAEPFVKPSFNRAAKKFSNDVKRLVEG